MTQEPPRLALMTKGSMVGRYRLTRLLGRGGYGMVFEAHDTQDAVNVAIKMVEVEGSQAGSGSALERFAMEVNAIRRIRHPNVVQVYESAQITSESHVLAYYTMEILEGQTLDEHVRAHGAMAPEQALGVVRQAAAGLHRAHTEGIIHRDIKPANIFLTAQGRSVVMDFGVCKLNDLGMGITMVGQVVGTPRYLAPEQLLDGTVDARTDVFALGLVLHFLLTGQHLRAEADIKSAFRAVTSNADVQRVRKLALPEDLKDVLCTALDLKPENRFENARALGEALEATQLLLNHESPGGSDGGDAPVPGTSTLTDFTAKDLGITGLQRPAENPTLETTGPQPAAPALAPLAPRPAPAAPLAPLVPRPAASPTPKPPAGQRPSGSTPPLRPASPRPAATATAPVATAPVAPAVPVAPAAPAALPAAAPATGPAATPATTSTPPAPGFAGSPLLLFCPQCGTRLPTGVTLEAHLKTCGGPMQLQPVPTPVAPSTPAVAAPRAAAAPAPPGRPPSWEIARPGGLLGGEVARCPQCGAEFDSPDELEPHRPHCPGASWRTRAPANVDSSANMVPLQPADLGPPVHAGAVDLVLEEVDASLELDLSGTSSKARIWTGREMLDNYAALAQQVIIFYRSANRITDVTTRKQLGTALDLLAPLSAAVHDNIHNPVLFQQCVASVLAVGHRLVELTGVVDRLSGGKRPPVQRLEARVAELSSKPLPDRDLIKTVRAQLDGAKAQEQQFQDASTLLGRGILALRGVQHLLVELAEHGPVRPPAQNEANTLALLRQVHATILGG